MNQEVHYSGKEKKRKWSALDPDCCHPAHRTDTNLQSAEQVNKTLQSSEEYIFIKDSCDITVSTTDTKAAISLQAALQAAIALVINISIADSSQAERVTQDLLQTAKTKQMTFQKTVVENSRKVDVKTTDTQIAINLQVLLQILLALIVNLNIL
ncbi:spore coat protein [Salipaludibacillus sp. LMS25]|jgi:spore coat protein X|uniref:spore coat protein n=1 Tax=Salipaludibacillus sp. LMS25 TaxID=2924031 RepID=UPI0020D01B67|nr:spore coat protein [Salipaludibacillus sp. LMS25]UTR13272.1 spore coat protein [Salipaludibacillus sp. LMS25]